MALSSETAMTNESMEGHCLRVDFESNSDAEAMVVDSCGETDKMFNSMRHNSDGGSRTIASIPDLTPSNSQDDAGKEVVPADGDDVPITFPQRLIGMLEAETESGEEIITWLPHGKAFIIYQKKRFASEVLVHHFKQSKFTSFTRKLNRWGFTRIATGPDTGAYYHKLFQRKKPKLCLQMYCQNYGPSQAALNQKLSKSIDKATSSVMPPMKLPATALMSMSVLEIPEYADALEKSKASTRPLMLAIRRTLQRLG